MARSTRQRKTRSTAAGDGVPPKDWGAFLERFSREHTGWPVRLETHDRVTGENVATRATPLETIELDLEDEKNPRINVIVRFDNKVIKHILFLPSYMVLESSPDGRESRLRIRTVNTDTTVHLKGPAGGA